jgi:hypothetical protein
VGLTFTCHCHHYRHRRRAGYRPPANRAHTALAPARLPSERILPARAGQEAWRVPYLGSSSAARKYHSNRIMPLSLTQAETRAFAEHLKHAIGG